MAFNIPSYNGLASLGTDDKKKPNSSSDDKKKTDKAAKKKAEDEKHLRDNGLSPTSQSGIEAITDPMPSGPLAMTQLVRGEDGKMHSVYVDATTGQALSDLKGYTIIDGQTFYDVTASDDKNKDGKVSTSETDTKASNIPSSDGSGRSVLQERGSGTSALDGPQTPGPAATASNNFGYTSKPSGLGVLGLAAGVVNPALGGAVSMASKAINVGNMSAVNEARKGLGLPGLTGAQQVKGALKDNRGQIANVNIGDNKYSVGFEALSPDNKTNLTYNEAKTREALAKTNITETPKDQVTKAPEKTSQSLASKITGLNKGWLTKALNQLVGVDPTSTVEPGQVEPTVAQSVPTPTAKPSQEASIGLPQSAPAPTSATNTTPTSSNGVGLIGRPNNPGVIAGATPDALGRVSLQSVDFDKMGLQPAMAAQMKSFQKAAAAQNLDLSVDVANMNRTAAQQQSIVDAGYSKTNNSYHRVGLAADISATKLNAKNQPDPATQAASRALAEKLGLNTLSASFDPAHVEAHVPGETAKSLMNRPRDAFGNIQLSPEEDLSVRNNSVPTPTERPSTTPEVDRNYSGQGVFGTDDATATPGPNHSLGAPSVATSAPIGPNHSLGASEASTSLGYIGANHSLGAPAPDGTDYSGAGALPNADSIGMTPSTNTTPHANNNLGTTPAALAAMGFTPRSATQKAEMARTIAGELSQKSLKALASTDPATAAAAKNEVGSMLATMENRAASDKYGSISKTLAPSQYNSLFSKNLKTTNQNYANNKDSINAAVSDYYSGNLPDANYGATNYHATNMSKPPGWSKAMSSVSQIGDHTFGNLPGYTPSAASQAASKAFGTMAGTSYSPGKASDDAVGPGTSNPSQYGGAGYTPGGMDSPSNSSRTPAASTGLGVPGYGGVGLGYGGVAQSGNSTPASGNSGASASSSPGGSTGSGASGAGSGGGASGGGIGRGASTGGSPAASGGYATGATKGSTGGL
jgi:hypothetical protein